MLFCEMPGLGGKDMIHNVILKQSAYQSDYNVQVNEWEVKIVG